MVEKPFAPRFSLPQSPRLRHQPLADGRVQVENRVAMADQSVEIRMDELVVILLSIEIFVHADFTPHHPPLRRVSHFLGRRQDLCPELRNGDLALF